ncbi:MAG: pyridoxamine 5'-phosphate oxidase family protein [Chloroflexi bacterium]|nr:pyridoxamine 5'-phosphate oxidase family protein [Chloroflexota bacterium]
MALQIGPRLQAFFDTPLPIVIGTTRSNGSVQMNPIWYEFRDGLIWLNGGPQRGWVRHLQRHGRATLLVLDANNMFRWAQLECRYVDATAEGADEHIERLSHRYTGGPYRNPKVDRLIVRVSPERVTGFESGQAWDVTT